MSWRQVRIQVQVCADGREEATLQALRDEAEAVGIQSSGLLAQDLDVRAAPGQGSRVYTISFQAAEPLDEDHVTAILMRRVRDRLRREGLPLEAIAQAPQQPRRQVRSERCREGARR
jgi:hypothetical protein